MTGAAALPVHLFGNRQPKRVALYVHYIQFYLFVIFRFNLILGTTDIITKMHVTRKKKLHRERYQTKTKIRRRANNKISINWVKNHVEKIENLENEMKLAAMVHDEDVERIENLENVMKEAAKIHEEEKISLNHEVQSASNKYKHIEVAVEGQD